MTGWYSITLLLLSLLSLLQNLVLSESPPTISSFSLASSGASVDEVSLSPGDQIRCIPRVSGDPKPSITFYKNGQPFSTVQPDTWLKQSQLSDAGAYYIIANNSMGSAISKTITLHIFYMNPWADTATEQTQTVLEGSSLVLDVPPIEAYPQPNDGFHSWINADDNQSISNSLRYHTTLDRKLVLLDIQQSTNGEKIRSKYTELSVTGPRVTLSKTFIVNVQSSTPSTISPSLIVGLPGITKTKKYVQLSLECVFNAKPIDDIQISWKQMSGEGGSVRNLPDTGRILKINPVLESHNLAKIECHATSSTNSDVNIVSSTTINVLVEPQFPSPIDSRYNQDLGDTVGLPCSATGNPVPTIQWFKNAQPINTATGLVVSPNGTLTIFDLQLSDRGVYQCFASNEIGQVRAQTYLNIISSAPVITTPPEDQTLIAGEEAVLICVVVGKPDPLIKWIFTSDFGGPPVELGNGGRFRINRGSLTINPSQANIDSGVYQCKAENSLGVKQASAQLTVYNHTSITGVDTNRVEEKGSEVIRSCMLNKDSRITAQIIWYRNNVLLTTDSQRLLTNNNQTLTFTHLRSLVDQGVFRCDVTSLAGNATQSHNITVKEVPLAPEVQAVLHPDTKRAIKLTWRTPFDGNRPILHYILKQNIVESPVDFDNWITIAQVEPDAVLYIVENLQPSKSYEFRLTAVNDFGIGQHSVATNTLMIEPEPPSAPPQDIRLEGLSSTSIRIQWLPPPEDKRYGTLTGYSIQYSLSESSTSPRNDIRTATYHTPAESRMTFALSQLSEYDTYHIRIAAINAKGIGVYSTSQIIRTREGEPTQSPDSVDARAVSSTAITVRWKRPPQSSIKGLTKGFRLKAFKNGIAPSVNVTASPTNTEYETADITGLDKYSYYKITVTLFTDGGESPAAETDATTLQDVPGAVNMFKVELFTHESFKLVWSQPVEPNGNLTEYNITISGTGNSRSYSIIHPNTTIIVDNLLANSEYSCMIRAKTVIGYGPSKTITVTTRPPPRAPEPPHHLAIAEGNIRSRSVVLSFTPGYNGQAPVFLWIVQGRTTLNDEWRNISQTANQPNATYVTVIGLTPYTEYYFRLIAVNIANASHPSNSTLKPIKTKMDKPDHPPLDVKVRAQNYSTLILEWQPLTLSAFNGESQGYLIEYTPEFDSNKQYRTVENPSSRFLILDKLEAFTRYEIKMYARNSNFTSDPSSTASGITIEHVPRVAPTNIQATVDSSSQITVSWSPLESRDRNGDIRGYNIKYGELSQPSDQYTVEQSESTQITLTQLTSYTQYNIQVSAYTRFGSGPYSTAVRRITRSSRPDPPEFLSVVSLDTSHITLSWKQPTHLNSAGPVGYQLTYRPTSSPSSDNTHNLLTTYFQLTPLNANTMYSIELRCNTTAGQSDVVSLNVTTTPSIQQKVPSTPTNLRISQTKSRDLTLNWNHADSSTMPVRNFTVYIREETTSYTPLNDHIPGTARSHTIKNLTPDTEYYLQLAAYNDKGKSTQSQEVTQKTVEEMPAEPPTDIKIVPESASSLTISWSFPQQNTWNGVLTATKLWYAEYGPSLVPQWRTLDIQYPATEAPLTSLQAGKLYEIQLSCVNSRGSGKTSSPHVIYVGVAVPIGTPDEVNSSMISATELMVTWSPIDENEINGQLLGYKVYYEKMAARSKRAVERYDLVGPQETSHIIRGLETYTQYKVDVAAYNIAGEGPRSDTVFVHTDQGKPGPPRSLAVSEITLNTVNVSWIKPEKPNGNITHYIITLVPHSNQAAATHTEIIVSAPAENQVIGEGNAMKLETNSTYTISVRGKTERDVEGEETEIVYKTGPSLGVPDSPSTAAYTIEEDGVLFTWTVDNRGSTPLEGYVIEGLSGVYGWTLMKRSKDNIEKTKLMNDEIAEGISRYRVSVFNSVGLGTPTETTEFKPFYKTWWFLVILALAALVIIITIISVLCCYCYRMRAKMAEQAYEQDVLGVDSEFPSYEMRDSLRRSGYRSSSKLRQPPRPSPGAVMYNNEVPPRYDDSSSVTDKGDLTSEDDEKGNLSGTDSSDDDIDKGGSVTPSYNHYQYGGYNNYNHTAASSAVQESWQNSFRGRQGLNMYSYTDSEAESTAPSTSRPYRPSMNGQASTSRQHYPPSHSRQAQYSNRQQPYTLRDPPPNVSSFI